MNTQELPEGTVTVLFTDTVHSTQRNQAVGDEKANLLRQAIVALCREQVELHRGVEAKGTGDGLMLAFQSATRAVRCAQGIQRAIDTRNTKNPAEQTSLRMGMHTGEVIRDEEDLFGETVVIASRLEQAAEPGSILASRNVRDLLGTGRDALIDRGEIALKGLSDAWQVYEVPWEQGAVPGDADAPAPMVGRDADRDRLTTLLDGAMAGRGALVMIGARRALARPA